MIVKLTHQNIEYSADLSKPLDLSIPLSSDKIGVNCFYAAPFEALPVVMGSFVCSTKEGGVVNFKNVKINPHGNGTHTECVGHISKEDISINETLKSFHFISELISVYPTKNTEGDRIISLEIIKLAFENKHNCDALIIRTLPNHISKKEFNYSGTNPAYITADAISFLVNECKIQHLLIDLPSVDKEQDEGKLAAHKAFWLYPETLDLNKTITELVYVDDNIKDGLYLLNLQIAPFGIDASPSKPILYKLI